MPECWICGFALLLPLREEDRSFLLNMSRVCASMRVYGDTCDMSRNGRFSKKPKKPEGLLYIAGWESAITPKNVTVRRLRGASDKEDWIDGTDNIV